MSRIFKSLALIVAIGGIASVSVGGACNGNTVEGDTNSGNDSPGSPEPGGNDKGGGVLSASSGDIIAGSLTGTFEYLLRPGAPGQDGGSRPPLAVATPLSDKDTTKLLARLPAIGQEDGDVVDFALREGSKPPPLTGDTIQAAFPPPVAPDIAPPDVAAVPPAVLRYQPEGDVPLAPRITVTFATPMVAITSHDTLAKEAVPAKMSPEIEGIWRWVGTKTLFFDPVGRAPMATDFKVEIPAGVKDALGRPLTAGKTFTFRTPPPSIVQFQPSGDDVQLEPLFFVQFDQRIDPEVALAKVVVTAGGKAVKVRKLTADEAKRELTPWQNNRDIDGRWLAFRVDGKLPKDTRIEVMFPKGFPSAEGPRTTEKDLRHVFKTYGPFKTKKGSCGWRNQCFPGMPYTVEFTNPIDEDFLDLKHIRVEPELAGMELEVWGNTLNIKGVTKGKTTYKVTISKEVRDIYGQALGDDADFKWVVGASRSLLSASIKPMTVLDPVAKKRRLPVYVMNMAEVDVSLYKVTPSDWRAYQKYTQDRWRDDSPKIPPGKEIFSGRVKTGAPEEELFEFGVDLGPALDGDFGHVIAVIKPTGIDKTWERDRMTVITWVQATRIGLDAFWDGQSFVAWATALGDGKPLEGVKVALTPPGTTAMTDAGGLARFELPTSAKNQMLIASKDGDVAFLDDDSGSWQENGNWVKQHESSQLRWLVFDDRHLYRPDETISVKGVIRLIEPGVRGDVAVLPAGQLTRVTWKAFDAQNNEIGKGEAPVSPLGTFHVQLKLPKTPNLGGAHFEFETRSGVANNDHYHPFEIQEFRRPEFEVSATVSDGPHIVGGSATVSISASYFAGGPLPNAEVTWTVNTTPTGYTPPNHGDFVFGMWTPWWGWRGGHRENGWDGNYQTLTGMTDGSGTHIVGLDFKRVSPPRPVSVTAEATVQDVNRQTWSTTSPILVHPSLAYVGLKTDRWFVEANKPIEVQTIVTDIDGKRLVGTPVSVRIVRLEWKKVKKQGWVEVEVDAETCNVTSAADPVPCSFRPKTGGRHKLTARVEDSDKRPNETEISVWVPGGKQPADRDIKQEDVTIIPTKKSYEPGETAEFLVQAPFSPASGVYIVARGGIAETVPFTMDKDTATLKVKVEEWMIPGFHLQVQLNGAADRPDDSGKVNPNLPKRPAYARGDIAVEVPATLRRLVVEATPLAARTEPGAETAVDVVVRDAKGNPVSGAEVAVVVVDEAVLALTGHSYPDPIAAFYGDRGIGVNVKHLRASVMLAAIAELYGAAGNKDAAQALAASAEEAEMSRTKSMRLEGAGLGGGGMAPGMVMPSAAPTAMMEDAMAPPTEPAAASGPIAVRKNFDALAVFLPDGQTGVDGRLKVAVKLPDNLTRYRIVAVALHGARHFGKGESAVTARLPLMVRMSPPRFLNFGDRFELPVVLQNQTDKPLEVQLAVRATNATVTQGGGRKVTVPANDRVEVRLPMAAAKPGTARFQAGVVAGSWADAAEVKLPVWTPATTEAFATYGEIDKGGIRQPVRLPGEVETAFGGLEVQTSSTQLQALTEAVVYLVNYPYECSEQIASRMMALAALKDVLTAFKAPGLPKPEAMIASVDSDLKRLRGMQAYDGGFAFWRRDQETWPFLTVHVTHALLRARDKGFDVPGEMIQQALGYLRNIRSHMTREWYTEAYKRTIESYALYVRNRAGDTDGKRAAAILREEGGADKANLEVVGWLYPVLAAAKDDVALAAIRLHLNNRVSETAGAAHFVTSYGDGAYLLLHSDRRVDGLLLEALIGDQPKSDLIPKLVRGLLGHRKAGVWQSTQENAWVLLALDRYFAVFEKDVPNFTARAWLGQLFAGEHTFKGRTTERHEINVPMAKLAEMGGAADLTLAKDGPGRLYYRIGMRYAPKSLKLEPSNHGFHVERTYLPVDDKDDVKREADGRWVMKAGARVKVKLTMHTEDRRYHVALVDPMPAGLEALNPELKGTQAAPPRDEDASGGIGDAGTLGRGRYFWWWGPWYEHENLRDERAEAFTTLLWDGVYTYTYFARATTPGEFVVPPPKAEEMYSPETFGRGASDIVIVR